MPRILLITVFGRVAEGIIEDKHSGTCLLSVEAYMTFTSMHHIIRIYTPTYIPFSLRHTDTEYETRVCLRGAFRVKKKTVRVPGVG